MPAVIIDLHQPLASNSAEILSHDEALRDETHPNHHASKRAMANWFAAHYGTENAVRRATPFVFDSAEVPATPRK